MLKHNTEEFISVRRIFFREGNCLLSGKITKRILRFFFKFLISRGQWFFREGSCPLLPFPVDAYGRIAL